MNAPERRKGYGRVVVSHLVVVPVDLDAIVGASINPFLTLTTGREGEGTTTKHRMEQSLKSLPILIQSIQSDLGMPLKDPEARWDSFPSPTVECHFSFHGKRRTRPRAMMLAQWRIRSWFKSFPTKSCFLSTLSENGTPFKSRNGGHLQSVYRSMVAKQEIQSDSYQLQALQALDRLYDTINDTTSTNINTNINTSTSTSCATFAISNIWSRLSSNTPPPPPRGVYLHGGVGCGKSFCMNLFFRELPIASKQAVHFHTFLLSVHQRMHDARHLYQGTDLLHHVASHIRKQGTILCFDEFQITDVADAMILQRLFTALWAQGCIIVATSNRPPCDLYLGGLQRDRFIPFIQLLEQQCQVVSLWDSHVDYRLLMRTEHDHTVYFLGHERQEFDRLFHSLTEGAILRSTTLPTQQGRLVAVPRAAPKGICRFTFDELCQKALGAADYLVIGQHFHTVFLEGVPTLGLHELNWVRRFIIFVDSMYESHVKLVVLAKGQPDELFTVDLDNQNHDEVFAFDRTRSRLEEMRSTAYLRKRWVGKDTTASVIDTILLPV